SIRFVALLLILLPASLPAQNQKIPQAGPREDEIACTSYPEWTCFPTGRPARPETAEERTSRESEAARATATTPAYTSYPEWTWLPQSTASLSTETQPTETAAAPTSQTSADSPNCTSYPEWTCFPEVNEAQRSQVVQAKKTKSQTSSESRQPARQQGGAN